MKNTGGKLEAFINNVWYGDSHTYIVLLPLTALFALLAALRRYLYRQGILGSKKIPVPVVVIGNIAVGGAGKTPVTLWLAGFLKDKGLNPAIISRGYGGRKTSSSVLVTAESDPALVGDEPVLLARRSGCPVFVDADRVRAALSAVRNGADVILADDGLQHYRLRRDIEIVVVDGSRGFGNGHLLPAGPLREPMSRLDTVDRILLQQVSGSEKGRDNSAAFAERTTRFSLAGQTLKRIGDGQTRVLSELSGKSVHAVAGIANPNRFFEFLEQHDIEVLRHPKPDHARLSDADIRFDDDLDVIVTEKDAVKCANLSHGRLWYLPVTVTFGNDEDMQWIDALRAKLRASVSQEPA
jgi:tetraacyldisaccharide 4'-kinase